MTTRVAFGTAAFAVQVLSAMQMDNMVLKKKSRGQFATENADCKQFFGALGKKGNLLGLILSSEHEPGQEMAVVRSLPDDNHSMIKCDI